MFSDTVLFCNNLLIQNIIHLRCFICLIGFGLMNVSFAAERIEIVKSEGGVSVSQTSGGKSNQVSTKSVLPAVNVLSTSDNGRVVVRVGNTGFIVLEKNSRIEINTIDKHAGFFRHLTGIVYYAVNSLKGKDSTLEVRTKASTIGIRGTRFLVSDITDHSEIGMRKGTISVTSLKGEFEVHKQSEQDEFESMKKEAEAAVDKEKADFDAYKENIQHEFIEYKHELTLEANRMLSFDGNRVEDRPLNPATIEKMETLENYADKWISEVQD
jgi:hypothetical protein